MKTELNITATRRPAGTPAVVVGQDVQIGWPDRKAGAPTR
jgi:hypothetical protein